MYTFCKHNHVDLQINGNAAMLELAIDTNTTTATPVLSVTPPKFNINAVGYPLMHDSQVFRSTGTGQRWQCPKRKGLDF